MLEEVKVEDLTVEDMTKEEYFHRKNLERMMKAIPGSERNKAPMCCMNCKDYRPSWTYRTCARTQCRYDTERDVFREKPLKDRDSMERDV